MDQCYYNDSNVCEGELWECQTCHEQFCQAHNHSTSKGQNVECVGCEGQRKEQEEETPEPIDVEQRLTSMTKEQLKEVVRVLVQDHSEVRQYNHDEFLKFYRNVTQLLGEAGLHGPDDDEA